MTEDPAMPGEADDAADGVPPSGIYIKQVALILGVSPSMLRAWESERLITPGRSSSGYRIYEAKDVERLRHIRDLIQKEGLNAAGVRRQLEADDNVPSPPTGTEAKVKAPAALSERVQMMRKAQARSLRDLAAETGISASAISAIERGFSAPSVRTLRRLAEAFDTTVPLLLGTADNPESVVVHPEDRQVLDLGIPGVKYETLFTTNRSLQSMIIELEPGSGSSESYSHEGEEFLYVLRGQIELTLDEIDVYLIASGDAVTYQSPRPHRLVNPGTETATMIWVNTPPSI